MTGGKLQPFSSTLKGQHSLGLPHWTMTSPVIGTACVRQSDRVNISSDNRPILLVKTEHFMNLRLLPHQQIEDYYSKIIDMGRRIHKTAQNILLKFIEGLPPKLAFFVRAGNPEDIQGALTTSKLGEAYGYRASLLSSSFTTTQHHQDQPIRTTPESTECVPSVPIHNVCAAQKPVGDRMSRLEQRLDSLCNQFQKLNTDS